MSITRLFLTAASAILVSTQAFADLCDYKPSKLAGEMVSTAAATIGGGAVVAGAGMKAAGYYTLVHSASGLTMLGSTAAGASAAGTTGIIAGTAGAGATIASVLMAPVTIVAGAVTVIAIGGFEGACYFQIERVEDPYRVLGIIESIADNDPAVSIAESDEGLAMILSLEEGEKDYLIRNLYIADGDLLHRDWLKNTNLGPVAYVRPEAKKDQ